MRGIRVISILMVCIGLIVLPAAAQDEGIAVTCDNGANFENGVEVRVQQMRAGFTYTATAIGVDGFDPVLAVLNESGSGFCSDNAAEAANYTVNLPTTGGVSASSSSAQVRFNQATGQEFADVSLVVGSPNNTEGEFVLLLEGMAATAADGDGDPFAVRLTPGMVASGVPLTVYMISVTDDLDPLISRIEPDYDLVYDDANNIVGCDDAGDAARCWGQSSSLGNSFITRTNGRQLPGISTDAMLSIPLDGVTLDPDPDFRFLNYLMTSYQQSTFGDYVLAFHIGLSEGSSGSSGREPGTKEQPGDKATPIPQTNSGAPSGIAVTCDNGASFENGVEVSINLMRAGFTYTATAIGIDGFDPVLAVLGENGQGLCSDNERGAASFNVNLPTTGAVASSTNSAQVNFSQTSGQNMANVSLVVGSVGNTSGEFVLILEGMAATAADGPGDGFSVRLTPGMVSSGVPLNAYMISVTDDLDPLMARVDPDYNVLYDDANIPILCDDAGDAGRCWGENSLLNNASVSITGGRQLGGFSRDAMLSVPVSNIALDPDPDFNFINFVMTSYQQTTFGDYIVAFHIGISEGSQADI